MNGRELLNGDGTGKCVVRQPFGWKCTRGWHLLGPHALKPRWWNLRDHYWYWRVRR